MELNNRIVSLSELKIINPSLLNYVFQEWSNQLAENIDKGMIQMSIEKFVQNFKEGLLIEGYVILNDSDVFLGAGAIVMPNANGRFSKCLLYYREKIVCEFASLVVIKSEHRKGLAKRLSEARRAYCVENNIQPIIFTKNHEITRRILGESVKCILLNKKVHMNKYPFVQKICLCKMDSCNLSACSPSVSLIFLKI